MMEGLRYERGGKGKYWIPQPTSRTGLLTGPGPSNMERDREIRAGDAESGSNRAYRGGNYGAMDEPDINDEDERLYTDARTLEYGDYNVYLLSHSYDSLMLTF